MAAEAYRGVHGDAPSEDLSPLTGMDVSVLSFKLIQNSMKWRNEGVGGFFSFLLHINMKKRGAV